MTTSFNTKSLAEYLAEEDEEFDPHRENCESNTSVIDGQFGNIHGIYSGEEEEVKLRALRTCDGGEIIRMLQNTLGVLPPTDRLPANSVTKHKTNNQQMITDDNLPIFLDEKYFKMENNAKQTSNANTVFNGEKKYYTGREIYMMKRNHTKLNGKKSK